MADALKHRAKTQGQFNDASSRPSMKGGDILSLYGGENSKGTGSIYTSFAPKSPIQGGAKNLDQQRTAGVDFFGVGRNKMTSAGQAQDVDNILIAGGAQGIGTQEKSKPGDIKISGFVPKMPVRGPTCYGNNDPQSAAEASWYTQGLAGVERYGNALSGIAGQTRSDMARFGGARSTSDGANTGNANRSA